MASTLTYLTKAYTMKLHHIILGMAMAAGCLTACDEVDSDKRFIGPVVPEARKNVLIEDFTGQKCVNCPSAADMAASLQQLYGAEHVVAVSIHGGSLSRDEATDKFGLANATSKAYNEHWGVSQWPSGMIDRTGGLQGPDKWAAAVLTRIIQQPAAELNIANIAYDAASKTLNLDVSVTANESVTGRLQVWLTESGVVQQQYMPDGTKNNQYVHNHVLRASVNDPYGDPLTLAANATDTKHYTYTLPDVSALKNNTPWNTQNMSVVVFFYNDQHGVMQVIDHKLQ